MHGKSCPCIFNDKVTVWMSVQLAQLVERPHRMREESPSPCEVLLGCRTVCVLWGAWTLANAVKNGREGEGVLVFSHILPKRSFNQFWNWNCHTFLCEDTTTLSCFIFWIRQWLYSYYKNISLRGFLCLKPLFVYVQLSPELETLGFKNQHEGADGVRGREEMRGREGERGREEEGGGRRGGGRREREGKREGGERGKFCARKSHAAPEGRRETRGGSMGSRFNINLFK